MSVVGKRWLIWSGAALLLAGFLVYAFRPQPVAVDTLTLQPVPFRVTLDADGVTQIRDLFTISAPVGGRVLRNPLEVGDRVEQGLTVVATIEPSDPAFLDPRAQAESRHELEAAEAELDLAKAELARTEAERTFAAAEQQRAESLYARSAVPLRFVEDARRSFRTADAAVAAARAAADVREHQVRRARARLIMPVSAPFDRADCDCILLKAPVDGRILRLFAKSEAVVVAGTPLLEVGDPGQIEIVADFLSADAVRIEPGQYAEIAGWGGEDALEARVRRVEPFGFTKISALGIEEQRVNVVLDLISPPGRWSGLGHGFRVVVRVIVWQQSAALAIPVTALFREAGDWRVFLVDGDRVRSHALAIGQRAGLQVEVTSGLRAGDIIVVNPSEALADGVRVDPQRAR